MPAQPTLFEYLRNNHKPGRKWWEVVVYYSEVNDTGTVVAQFKCEGDAYKYGLEAAQHKGGIYFYMVVVR
jgi:hypothetical protein